LKLDDLPAADAYAEASAWQMTALLNLGRFDDVRKVGDDATKVTRQVLERRPGDMLALRAGGLMLGTLTQIEFTELHLHKALAMAREAASNWEAIVRLDPTNQIAWNNLADQRIGVSASLWLLGEIDEARKQMQAALDVGHQVKEVAFIGTVLALASGYLVRLDADTGDRKGAEAMLAANKRFVALAIRDLPAGAFGRAYAPEFLGYYGYQGSGFGFGALAIPEAEGDYETVRSLARASAARLEQIHDPTPAQAESRDGALELAYRTIADASYRLKDYSAADSAIKRALALRKTIPTRTLGDERDAGTQAVLAGMIAARLGRNDEARRLIDPVVDMQRKLHERKDNEDQTQRMELAQALYASALAGSQHRAADLREAATLMDALPPQMRAMISVRRLRADIAEAQAS
jgi:tetratricopeptide (TPR) repeat protein